VTTAGRAEGAVADAVAPPPRHPRFPLIDGIRAIAVLSVVLVHAASSGGAIGDTLPGRLLAHLNIGVTIFFVISGFLLYRPFIAERGGGPPPPAFVDYGRRRFLRIFPAYWLVLTVLVILPFTTGVVNGEGLQQYALLQTLPLADGGGCTVAYDECGLAQTWSLVVELTFYIALPAYVVVSTLLARGRPLRRWVPTELALLALLAAVSVYAALGLDHEGARPLTGGTVLGFAYWFALGLGLAIASVAISASPRRGRIQRLLAARPELPWALAAGLYLALCLWLPPSPFIFERDQRVVTHLAFGLIALLVVVPAVIGGEEGGAPRRLLAQRPVAWLGLISYGIFLWHFPVIMELDQAGGMSFVPLLTAALAITIPIAALSYYVLERPLLRLKYRRPAKPPAASGTSAAST
jgi:peptidoglycan/LPS O-acetylase OafA/YrhL